MHKALHIILAVLLIWSSSGLPLARHYCMGLLKGTGWYGAEICGHGSVEEQEQQGGEAFAAIPCCEDEVDWLQTDETTVVENDLDLQPAAYAVLVTLFSDNTPEIQAGVLSGNRGPPDTQQPDFQAMLQVFRI